MKKITTTLISALLFTGILLSFSSSAFAITDTAQETAQVTISDEAAEAQALPPQFYPIEDFFTAIVQEIIEQGDIDVAGTRQLFQVLTLTIASGNEYGKSITLTHGDQVTIDAKQLVKKGEKVVIAKTSGGGADGGAGYYIADKYRLPPLFLAIAMFLALVMYFGRVKGMMSIIGLVFSVFILLSFIIPSIVGGQSPLLITLVGSFVIATVSIFLAHGFSKRTAISVLSTLITLTIAIVLALMFVELAQLFGLGSDEASYLRIDPSTQINLQGLLLGGIIIGTLGVLDDITTAQVAAVYELKQANQSFSAKDLYQRGVNIGREHIASLVNTLVLAYAGASLPLFLMFTLNASQPFWVTFNSEFIAEEVIRTLIGSMALILAVPISTWMAARYFAKSR